MCIRDSYELDSRYWDRGYATEAARAILKFGFDELNMRRIWAKCVADNIGSARVLEKMGMESNAELTYYAVKNGLVE